MNSVNLEFCFQHAVSDKRALQQGALVTIFGESGINTLFDVDKPAFFVDYAYLRLIHRLTYRRINHNVQLLWGCKDEVTAMPFDAIRLNDLVCFNLTMDVPCWLSKLSGWAAYQKQYLCEKLSELSQYIKRHDADLPEVLKLNWHYATGRAA